MKTLLLSMLLALPFMSLAVKGYKLTITVNQLAGMKPVQGVSVQYRNAKDEIMALGYTDEEGKVTFLGCLNKSFELIYNTSDGTFQEGKTQCSNKELVDMEEVVVLSFAPEKELEFMKNKMMVADLDTTHILKDSCRINNKNSEFPGGRIKLVEYLTKSIRVPAIAEKRQISGKVYLKIVIDHKGAVSGITVTKGIPNCPECDLEAVRVVAYMPDWIPASCDGEPVVSYYSFPVVFNIQ